MRHGLAPTSVPLQTSLKQHVVLYFLCTRGLEVIARPCTPSMGRGREGPFSSRAWGLGSPQCTSMRGARDAALPGPGAPSPASRACAREDAPESSAEDLICLAKFAIVRPLIVGERGPMNAGTGLSCSPLGSRAPTLRGLAAAFKRASISTPPVLQRRLVITGVMPGFVLMVVGSLGRESRCVRPTGPARLPSCPDPQLPTPPTQPLESAI